MKILKILFVLFTFSLSAYDTRPPCYRELTRDFFTYTVVAEALALWNVPQAQWLNISRALQKNAVQAEEIIKKGAERLQPNPFGKIYHLEMARDILHDTMYQIFERVVIDSGFYDTSSIKKMFEYIWIHDPRVHQCFKSS